jgi:hypothetical protein
MGDAPDKQAEMEHILRVLRTYQHELISKANVVGVAVGLQQKEGKPTNTLAMVVMVKQKIPNQNLPIEDQIPTSIEGIPVDVQEVGEITALQ